MKNITVAVPNDVYRQARVWAAERGVSLSKVVATLLEILPTHPRANRIFQKPGATPAPPSSASNPHPTNP